MINIKKGNAAPDHTNIFACIYGDPGMGKTSFAATADEPLLLDFDRRGHRAFGAEKIDRVDVASLEDISEIAQKYSKKYKTLIIDTAGRALDNKTASIIEQSKKSSNMKAHNPFGGLSLPGYGILKNSFYGVVQDVRLSGMHCVFVCHGKRSKEGDQMIWEPDVVGSSSDEIYKVCDLMGLLGIVNGRRALRLNPDERWQAKNPLGLETLMLDKKGETGWEVTLKDLIDQCVSVLNKTNTPVEPLEIVEKINGCNDLEQANTLLKELQAMPEGIDADMAKGAFKEMRKRNSFKYSTEKGVY